MQKIKFSFGLNEFFFASLVVSPLFLLVMKGWMTSIVVLCAVLGFCVWIKNRKAIEITARSKKDIQLLLFAFAFPLAGIFFSQLFRGDFIASYYDSYSHVIIGIFVVLGVQILGRRVVEMLSFVFPFCLILALFCVIYNPNLAYATNRVTTFAVDPLAFGSLSLTLGFMSLFSMYLHENKSKILFLFKIIGFCVGVYLSINSGSRTGWAAIPLVMFLWLCFYGKKFSVATKWAFATFFALSLICVSTLSENVAERLALAKKEIIEYQWMPQADEETNETSVGARISFIRMSVFLMNERPLSGWGDGKFTGVINRPELSFAGSATKRAALEAGFHNEITANMVRSGYWGLFYSIIIFIVPGVIILRSLKSDAKEKNVAFVAFVFLVFQFVSGMSMELINLRYAASFYGLMVSIFCGQLIYYRNNSSRQI